MMLIQQKEDSQNYSQNIHTAGDDYCVVYTDMNYRNSVKAKSKRRSYSYMISSYDVRLFLQYILFTKYAAMLVGFKCMKFGHFWQIWVVFKQNFTQTTFFTKIFNFFTLLEDFFLASLRS